MRLQRQATGVMTKAAGPPPTSPLTSGVVRRHVVLGAAVTALGGLLFGTPPHVP